MEALNNKGVIIIDEVDKLLEIWRWPDSNKSV